MNYQHAFHAGNFADLHKHVVLTRILDYLRQKPTAFRVIDTHGGAGRYDLSGPEAVRAQEWRAGIGALFEAMRQKTQQDMKSFEALLAPYLKTIAALNPGGALRHYPGSPLLAAALMRRQDRLIVCDTEPRAVASLKAALGRHSNAKVLSIDGWTALNANVPPKERRGVAIIDPPYEDAADFARLPEALMQAHRKWPTGIYLLWYPVKERDAPDTLARRLRRLAIAKILRCEIMLGPARSDGGLVGSGLILVNPPYTLEQELRILLPRLGNILSAKVCIDWLAGEQTLRDRN